jgi:hypothetical protein
MLLTRRSTRAVLGALFAAGLTGCPNYVFVEKVAQKVKEMQIVVPAATPRPADILFVVDNSCSMDNKQENLRMNFDQFINQIAGVGDYQIGVVTTDTNSMGTEKGGISVSTFATMPPFNLTDISFAACMPVPIDHGCFRGPDPATRIIKSSALSKDQQIAAFKANATVGSCGSGIEQGLKATINALRKAQAGQCNAGFLRDDANLVIIILSDENDTDTTPVEQYVNDLAQFKDYSKIRISAIVASEDGVAASCNAKDKTNCGKQVCATKPPDGSHSACMMDNQCPGPSSTIPQGETCQTNSSGGRWCENKALQFWDPKFCGWCTFFNGPDCCYAIANANPESDMPGVTPSAGRYIDFAKSLEARISASPGNAVPIPVHQCKTDAMPPTACLVDTICQDSFASTLSRIARELVIVSEYDLKPPTSYPPGVAVHISGGRFGDAGMDLKNCGATAPMMGMTANCDFTVSADGSHLSFVGPNTPLQGENVQIYFIVPAN